MRTGFVRLLFLLHVLLIEHSHPELLSEPETLHFFENEPVPLSASVVDDLTTLASAVYIVTLLIVVFILLAWVTHYNAPCSSMVTSLVSTVTGLPEPIIHSVAFCGSCCLWCEGTWLFRRVHHFNLWTSSRMIRLISGTCKMFFDTICPCCQPPDTPSNRSIIGKRSSSIDLPTLFLLGSLPAGLISMIHVPDHSSPPRVIVTGRDSPVGLSLSFTQVFQNRSLSVYILNQR